MKVPLDANVALRPLAGDVGAVAGYLWQKGWAERNAGNISADITALLPAAEVAADMAGERALARAYPALAGRAYLITGTGKRMRDLPKDPAANAALIRLTADGRRYHFISAGGFCCQPTSELSPHLGLHEMLRQAGAPQTVVLHTHPNELIALTHLAEYASEPALNRLLWAMHPETKVVLPEGAGFVPYQLPGSGELEAATVSAMRGRRVVLWEKHGAVSVGRDVFEAFDLIDTLNKSAQIYLLCRAAGARPHGLSDAQVAELERVFCQHEYSTARSVGVPSGE